MGQKHRRKGTRGKVWDWAAGWAAEAQGWGGLEGDRELSTLESCLPHPKGVTNFHSTINLVPQRITNSANTILMSSEVLMEAIMQY